MSSKRKFNPFKGDKSLWIIIASLYVISLLVVYSSTASMAYRNVGGDTSFYLFRQLRFIAMGFTLIYIVHWIDVRHYLRFSKFFFYVSLMLMGLAYIIGVSLNDAARWISIPVIGITFQPADAIKISLAMVLAVQLGTRQAIINRIPILPSFSSKQWRLFPQKNMDIFHRTTKPILMPVVLACVAIMPSNLSTSLILFTSSMIVLLVGRVRVKEIWRLVMLAMVSAVLMVLVMKVLGVGRAETWINRIEKFASPILGGGVDELSETTDFQSNQAKIAISSGGAFGKGPGNSTQRSQLPHPYSDFAYAFIIEEYGLIGAILIPILYLWVFYRARVIIYKTRRPVYGLLVLGLVLTSTLSAFIHIFVSTGIVPVTGQALPLISLGGSSVIFTSISFGMILSISRENMEEEAADRAALRELVRGQREVLLAEQQLVERGGNEGEVNQAEVDNGSVDDVVRENEGNNKVRVQENKSLAKKVNVVKEVKPPSIKTKSDVDNDEEHQFEFEVFDKGERVEVEEGGVRDKIVLKLEDDDNE